ncbi:MAG: DEAD/DEAH box helicase [Acidimicrobiales bacterium]
MADRMADRDVARQRVEAFLALARQAAAPLDDARTAVAAAATARARRLGAERLTALPLDAVRDVTGGNLRLSAIEKVGITDVGTLLRYDEHTLDTQVPGVGPQTAAQALAAARRLAEAVQGQVRVLPDPSAPDADGEALLAALRRLEHLWRTTSAPVTYATEARARLEPHARTLAEAPGRLRWAFAGRDAKAAVQAAADDVVVVLDSPYGATITAQLQAALQAVVAYQPLAGAALWADYQARGADYAAMLERAQVGVAAGRADQHGGLAAEVADAVEATTVDLTGLAASLRGYQEFGVKYVVAQRRVLLGDEMGLGKTLQALGAMTHLRNADGARHFLVVSPASIIENWHRETTGRSDLAAHLLHGPRREEVLATWHADGGVAITSYETLRTITCPPDLKPELLVVDEAHFAKNPSAARSRSVDQWAAWCDRVLLMTGTALENRLEELTRLVGLAQPAVAAGLGAQREALVAADPDAFRERLSPVYLRRNQEEVLAELPERIEVQEWVTLTPVDAAAYREAVVAGEMMAMRQAATLGDRTSPSAKLERLGELLDAYRESGEKVLVFSFFRSVLDQVVARAGEAETITGDVAPAERLAVIDRFSARPGFGVIACQIDAAGVGLNLQAASAVVLMEPQWKPSTEAQAIARAHRMGQTRRVVVHRLLARDAVDEALVAILAEKQQLFDAYADRSALAEATGAAVNVSETSLVALVLARERARLGLDDAPAADGDVAAGSTSPVP